MCIGCFYPIFITKFNIITTILVPFHSPVYFDQIYLCWRISSKPMFNTVRDMFKHLGWVVEPHVNISGY